MATKNRKPSNLAKTTVSAVKPATSLSLKAYASTRIAAAVHLANLKVTALWTELGQRGRA